MFDIDPAMFPPEIAELLLTRGLSLLPLDWASHPIRIAKASLEKSDDNKLFRRQEFADPAMAWAVRGLLFLWNGWPIECAAAASGAPAEERAYLEGLAARQQGKPSDAKACFGRHEGHDIHGPLADKSIRLIGSTTDLLLVRFKQMLEMTSAWEPHLFVDLYEQARGGKLNSTAEGTVRQMQCLEFELLLRHCYQIATGMTLPIKLQKAVAKDGNTENIERMRRLAEKHRPKKTAKDKSKSRDEKKDEKPEPEPLTPVVKATIRVACPKCRRLLMLPETARGEVERCGHCSTAFQVPGEAGKGPAKKPSMIPANAIGVRCPKCATTLSLPETARGQTERCGKCGTAFLVPGKPAAVHK